MKNVAVLGADGLIGRELVSILEQRNFPTGDVYFLAGNDKRTDKIIYKDKQIDLLSDYSTFRDKVELVFCCLDKVRARALVPKFKKKALVIDCSGAFSFAHDVLHVIPEVNRDIVGEHKGVIANPNPITIQLLTVLYPLHKKHTLKHLRFTALAAVSGFGNDALDELKYEYEFLALDSAVEKTEDSVFPYTIGDNVIPQVGDFMDKGATEEETILAKEIPDILGQNDIRVSATCVWVPVTRGNSVALGVDFVEAVSATEAKKVLKNAPGVKLASHDEEYPTLEIAVGKDEVFVGRIRQDITAQNGLAMWIVADNLRKGSALNAVQIAELV
jgi:aspartate-semialdehyde dehydrogenase